MALNNGIHILRQWCHQSINTGAYQTAPVFRNALHIQPLWMLSKAFSKSIKTMLRSHLCSTHCSLKMRNVLIWLVQDDPERKPAYSASIVECRCCFRRSRITFEIISATTASTQIPNLDFQNLIENCLEITYLIKTKSDINLKDVLHIILMCFNY